MAHATSRGFVVAPRLRIAASALLLFSVLACSHDLDALKSARNSGGTAGRMGGAGRAGSSSKAGTGGKGGQAGSMDEAGSSGSEDGGMAGSGPSPAACEPCEPLAGMAMMLDLRSCCRGPASDECGLTFGDGSVCLQRMVPTQDNEDCEGQRVAGMQLMGCCRPDSRCGVEADGLGLGCVAREDIPMTLGPNVAEPASCEFTCETDADCESVPDHVCAESPDHTRRYCARSCQRDQDCAKGRICGLSNDNAMDRVLAICRAPIGDAQPGEFCSAANDCVHGVCTRNGVGETFCTELCQNFGDCEAPSRRCVETPIPTPGMSGQQDFNICLP